MNEFEQLAAQYISVWNETDAGNRRAGVEALWSSAGRYVDPLAAAVGTEAIDATIGAVQAQFPGLVFRLAGPVDAHHDQARFQWELGPADGAALVVGFDVIERGPDGKLTQVLGFLDKVPG